MKKFAVCLGVLVLLWGTVGVQADDGATKDQAVAMGKKAIDYIKANGNTRPLRRSAIPRGSLWTGTSTWWSTT